MFDLRAIARSTSGANKLREWSAKSLSRRDAHKSTQLAIELGWLLKSRVTIKKKNTSVMHFVWYLHFYYASICYWFAHSRKYLRDRNQYQSPDMRNVNLFSLYIHGAIKTRHAATWKFYKWRGGVVINGRWRIKSLKNSARGEKSHLRGTFSTITSNYRWFPELTRGGFSLPMQFSIQFHISLYKGLWNGMPYL